MMEREIKKKNILIFAATYVPGVKGGGPIRSIKNIVDHLGDKYNFYIVTSDRDIGDKEPYKNITLNKWIELENSKVFYATDDWYTYKNIKKLMGNTSWDYVYLNSFFGYKFSIKPLLIAKKVKQKVIIAPRGELDEGALNLKKFKKNTYITLVRLIKIYNQIIWHATCEDEKKYIESIFGENSIVHIARNLTAISEGTNFLEKNNRKIAGELRVVFLSRISRKKNLKFAIKTLNKIHGDIIFDVYGPIEDENYWEECKVEISKLPKNVKVTYKGIVSNANVKTTLSNYNLFYLPTEGENFGHVIIEAFLSACPVLISDKTPWKELEQSKAGWDVALKDENKYIRILQNLVNISEEEYKQLYKSSFEYGLKNSTDNESVSIHSNLFKI